MQVVAPSVGQGASTPTTSQVSPNTESYNQHLTQMLINHNFEEKLSKLADTVNKLRDTNVSAPRQRSTSNYTPSKFYQQSPFSHNARNIPSFSTFRQQQNYRPAMHNQRFNRNQPFNENRGNSFRQNAPQSRNGLCYYHAAFGERARKCNPPCSMANQKNGESSSRQ